MASVLLIGFPVVFGVAFAFLARYALRRYTKLNYTTLMFTIAAMWISMIVGSLVGLLSAILTNRFIFDYRVLSDALGGQELFNFEHGPAVTPEAVQYLQFTGMFLVLAALTCAGLVLRSRGPHQKLLTDI